MYEARVKYSHSACARSAARIRMHGGRKAGGTRTRNSRYNRKLRADGRTRSWVRHMLGSLRNGAPCIQTHELDLLREKVVPDRLVEWATSIILPRHLSYMSGPSELQKKLTRALRRFNSITDRGDFDQAFGNCQRLGGAWKKHKKTYLDQRRYGERGVTFPR